MMTLREKWQYRDNPVTIFVTSTSQHEGKTAARNAAHYPRYCLVRKKSVMSQGTASAIFWKVATVGLDNFLYFFGEELAEAYSDKKYNRGGGLGRGAIGTKHMSTTNLFDLLANEFSIDDLRDLYRDKNRKDITGGALRNALSKWRQQDLITDTERRGVYRKCEKM